MVFDQQPVTNNAGETELLISIITICHNAEEFLEYTIQSVARQSYAYIEYIVVDGDSEDSTPDIIKRNQQYISAWVSEPDEGISDAFNKGYALSSGDYILYLNSDDMLHGSDAITEMVGYIMEYGKPKVIYADCNVLDRDTGEVRYRANIDYQPAAFLKGQTIPHPGLLLHRSYFKQYGLFDHTFSIAMDYELFLRGFLHEQVMHTRNVMTDVRDGGVSTVHRSQAVDEIIRALIKNKHVQPGLEEKILRAKYALRGLTHRAINYFRE